MLKIADKRFLYVRGAPEPCFDDSKIPSKLVVFVAKRVFDRIEVFIHPRARFYIVDMGSQEHVIGNIKLHDMWNANIRQGYFSTGLED